MGSLFNGYASCCKELYNYKYAQRLQMVETLSYLAPFSNSTFCADRLTTSSEKCSSLSVLVLILGVRNKCWNVFRSGAGSSR